MPASRRINSIQAATTAVESLHSFVSCGAPRLHRRRPLPLLPRRPPSFIKPELDPSWHMVSEYTLGAHGWVMTLCFLSQSLGCAALVVAIRSQVHGWVRVLGLFFLLAATIGGAWQRSFPPIRSPSVLRRPPSRAKWRRSGLFDRRPQLAHRGHADQFQCRPPVCLVARAGSALVVGVSRLAQPCPVARHPWLPNATAWRLWPRSAGRLAQPARDARQLRMGHDCRLAAQPHPKDKIRRSCLDRRATDLSGWCREQHRRQRPRVFDARV